MQLIFKQILLLPRSEKRFILIFVDVIILITALWVSFSLRLDDWYWPRGGVNNPIVLVVLFAPVLAVPTFIQFGLYRAIIRYIGIKAVWAVVKAVLIYSSLWGLLVFLSGVQGVPRSVVLINVMVSLLLVGGSRMFARWCLRKMEDVVRFGSFDPNAAAKKSYQRKVIIFGAGAAGRQLALGFGYSDECVLLAFVDDSKDLQGRDLVGVPILSQQQLKGFVEIQGVDDILLAIPSISRKQRNLIIERLRPLNIRIRTLPGLMEMARGQTNYSDLHELDINDLLSRQAAEPDEAMLQDQVRNQIVMVTGAGGSIGSELCRQILKRKPKVLLLFELSEFALYSLHNELLRFLEDRANEKLIDAGVELVPTIIPLLGSVADESRARDIVLTWQPKIIYHAAALKHVPIVEQNIAECVKTNVSGTLIMAKIAIEYQVSCFILISTDKAVNPTNAMGVSKRCCEMIIQALAAETEPSFDLVWDGEHSARVDRRTRLAMVRFGNVLGSSGSVVPHFRQQIAQGGPITLTHQDIIRYFMTIPEAAQLVMQTGAMIGNNDDGSKNIESAHKSGADVYVLDMGEPVKIYDLACRMIELSGFRVKDKSFMEGDIAIEVTGLRPGEKLYEELLIGNNPQKTRHSRIMKASEKFVPWDELKPALNSLSVAAGDGDVLMIRSIFKTLVPEYQPDENIADWIYRAQLAES